MLLIQLFSGLNCGVPNAAKATSLRVVRSTASANGDVLKRRAVAIDRSPAATFITKSYCSPANIKTLLSSYDRVLRQAKPDIDHLYETRCGGTCPSGKAA
jgi:hypothetical protein